MRVGYHLIHFTLFIKYYDLARLHSFLRLFNVIRMMLVYLDMI